MPKRVLIIIAQTGYQDIELAGTRKGLEEAGFEIVLASKEVGTCKGKLGGTEHATVAMRDVNVSDYDRVAFIGGPGAHALKDDLDALKIVKDVMKTDQPLGAICIAPTILAAAGALNNKRATVWNEDGEQQGFIEKYSAIYTGEPVTVDGRLVTANGPKAAEEFGRVFAGL